MATTRTAATRTSAAARPAASKARPDAKQRPAPAETPAPQPRRQKLVRDSFTIPKAEYALIGELKLRAQRLARPAKKSELLRAGIGALNAMSDKAFLAAIGAVPSLKTGRPRSRDTGDQG